MLSLKTVTLVCSLFVAVSCEEFETEEDVLVLKQSNFDKGVTEHKHVLVNFYAPWCGHCKVMAPEYAKAAKQLLDEGSEIKLAKVDATVETELAQTYGVQGYPTLKFFRDGKPGNYKGGHTAEQIVQWLKKRTGAPAELLTSADAARSFVDAAQVCVVGFFRDQASSDAKQFLDAAAATADHPFAIASDDEVYKELKVSQDGVMLFKKFDEGRILMEGAVTSDNVQAFVTANSLPLVVEFSQNSAEVMFGGDIKLHNLLFVSKENPDFEDLIKNYREAAKAFRGKVIFATIDVDDEHHGHILEFFGIKKYHAPTMRFIKMEGDMAKYKPDKDVITTESVRSFVHDVLDGKLEEGLSSQDSSEDQEAHTAMELDSRDFDDVVFDTKKDVLVQFHAPWCIHCVQLAPIFDELADKYKKRPDLVIARVEAGFNSVGHIEVEEFPTIRLYKKGNNEEVDYVGERTLDGLSRFLDTDGDYGKATREEVKEDEREEFKEYARKKVKKDERKEVKEDLKKEVTKDERKEAEEDEKKKVKKDENKEVKKDEQKKVKDDERKKVKKDEQKEVKEDKRKEEVQKDKVKKSKSRVEL